MMLAMGQGARVAERGTEAGTWRFRSQMTTPRFSCISLPVRIDFLSLRMYRSRFRRLIRSMKSLPSR